MNKIRIVNNTQIGTDSIEHLIGKEFWVESESEDELIVIHEGGMLPLGHDEYEYI